MLLEKVLEGRTRRLSCFVWLSVQQPRTLTDKGRKLGCLGRISPKIERQIDRRQHHIAETGAIENTPDACWVTPTELARLLRSQRRGRRHKMMDRRDACGRPRVFRP